MKGEGKNRFKGSETREILTFHIEETGYAKIDVHVVGVTGTWPANQLDDNRGAPWRNDES